MAWPPEGPALRAVAESALSSYELEEVSDVALIRHGENTTLRVDSASGRFALRLSRPGYQTPAAIASEVEWMSALNASGIRTPRVVAGRDGGSVQRVVDADGRCRPVVLFTWVEGVPLTQVDRLDLWRELGALMATIHEHGARWTMTPGFERPAWDLEAMLGEGARWGDPLRLARWTPEEESMLREAREVVRQRILAFGRSPETYGLIHADLSFDNVLVAPDGGTTLIDFDDGGYGWFLYDVAASLFPHAGRPGYAERRDALVSGYESRRSLHGAGELPTFVMARRLATLGWTFSRAETAHAKGQLADRLAMLRGQITEFLTAAS